MKRKLVIIPLALLLMGVSFVLFKFIEYKIQTKTPDVTKSAEDIITENEKDLATTAVSSNIKDAKDIYTLIHHMANTLIEAEDGEVWGEKTINNQSVNKAMKIVISSEFLTEEEREILLNVLQAWKEKDYSNGVEAHNYVWKKLNGNIGRAKELLPQYK